MAQATNTDPYASQILANSNLTSGGTVAGGQSISNNTLYSSATNQWSLGATQNLNTPIKCDYEKCPSIEESLSFKTPNGKILHMECMIEKRVDARIDKLLHEKSGLAKWLEAHRK